MKNLSLIFTASFIVYSLSLVSQHTSNENELFKSLEKKLTDSFLLDENIANSGIINEQRFPKVASDGNIFLSAWTDFRTQSTQDPDIYASRIDEEGNVMDIGGIPVCTVERVQYILDVVYDGNNFIVIWNDGRVLGQTDVYFARITPSGEVLDPDGIQATFGANMVSYNDPAVATGDGITLLMWCEDLVSGTHAVKCLRIDQDANILDPDGIIVSDTLNDSSGEMAASYDGTNFLIVWESGLFSLYDDIRGARVSNQGNVLDPGGFTIAHNPDDQWVPRISFGINKYLVVWTDSQGDDNDIYGTFVHTDGSVSDTTGFPIAAFEESQEFPGIDFDGTNFIVSWTDRRYEWDFYATGVTPDGVVLSTTGWGVGAWPTTLTRYGDIACGDNYILAIWENRRFPMETDIQGGRIKIEDYSMPDLDGFDVSVGTYAHANPSTAFDGTNYLVVWEDRRNNISQIWGTRVGNSGQILDPDGIQIGYNDSLQLRNPSVSFNGVDYMVAWGSQNSEGYSAGGQLSRISTEGIVLDDPAVTIINDNDFSWNFFICSDGSQSLITWFEYNSSYDIWGTIVGQDASMGIPFEICTANADQDFPKTAYNGTNYLVIWEDRRNGSEDIFGTLISPDGTVLNPDGIEIGASQPPDIYPSVCSNGDSFMVTWHAGYSSSESIYGTMLASDGSILLNSVTIYDAGTYEHAQKSSVAFDGTNYLVCWQLSSNTEPDQDIMGIVMDEEGTLGQQFIINNDDGNQFAPKLCAGNDGQVFASYTGYTEEINGQLVNTFRTYGNYIDQLIGIKSLAKEDLIIQIYPNPTKYKFEVRDLNSQNTVLKFGSEPFTIELFDLNGRKLFEKNIPPGQKDYEFNVSHLKSGVYCCKISNDGESITQKLIIQN
jgi:hypothetical protein